jgi:TatD DNase family protein
MAPEPFRGKRNDPGYLPKMAEKLAEIRGISLEEVEKITTANAKRLYRIEG